MDEYGLPVERDKEGDITLSDPMTESGLSQIKALVRFYFHVEPQNFNDLVKAWGQLKFALQFDGKLKIKETKKG